MNKQLLLKLKKSMESIGYHSYALLYIKEELPTDIKNEKLWLTHHYNKDAANFYNFLFTKNNYDHYLSESPTPFNYSFIKDTTNYIKIKKNNFAKIIKDDIPDDFYHYIEINNKSLMEHYLREILKDCNKTYTAPPFEILHFNELANKFTCNEIIYIISTLPISSHRFQTAKDFFLYINQQPESIIKNIDENLLAKAYIKTKNQHKEIDDDQIKKFENLFFTPEIIEIIKPYSRFLNESQFSLNNFIEQIDCHTLSINVNIKKMSNFMTNKEYDFFSQTYPQVFQKIAHHYGYKSEYQTYPATGELLFFFSSNQTSKHISIKEFWNNVNELYTYSFKNKLSKDTFTSGISNIIESLYLDKNIPINNIQTVSKKNHKF